MQLSTTPTLQGSTIAQYCGIVSSEAMLSVNIFHGFFTNIRHLIGGRLCGYEVELHKARQIAFTKLQAQAEKLAADAVVGITIDYHVVGKNGSMVMLNLNGTAVKLD